MGRSCNFRFCRLGYFKDTFPEALPGRESVYVAGGGETREEMECSRVQYTGNLAPCGVLFVPYTPPCTCFDTQADVYGYIN